MAHFLKTKLKPADTARLRSLGVRQANGQFDLLEDLCDENGALRIRLLMPASRRARWQLNGRKCSLVVQQDQVRPDTFFVLEALQPDARGELYSPLRGDWEICPEKGRVNRERLDDIGEFEATESEALANWQGHLRIGGELRGLSEWLTAESRKLDLAARRAAQWVATETAANIRQHALARLAQEPKAPPPLRRLELTADPPGEDTRRQLESLARSAIEGFADTYLKEGHEGALALMLAWLLVDSPLSREAAIIRHRSGMDGTGRPAGDDSEAADEPPAREGKPNESMGGATTRPAPSSPQEERRQAIPDPEPDDVRAHMQCAQGARADHLLERYVQARRRAGAPDDEATVFAAVAAPETLDVNLLGLARSLRERGSDPGTAALDGIADLLRAAPVAEVAPLFARLRAGIAQAHRVREPADRATLTLGEKLLDRLDEARRSGRPLDLGAETRDKPGRLHLARAWLRLIELVPIRMGEIAYVATRAGEWRDTDGCFLNGKNLIAHLSSRVPLVGTLVRMVLHLLIGDEQAFLTVPVHAGGLVEIVVFVGVSSRPKPFQANNAFHPRVPPVESWRDHDLQGSGWRRIEDIGDLVRRLHDLYRLEAGRFVDRHVVDALATTSTSIGEIIAALIPQTHPVLRVEL